MNRLGLIHIYTGDGKGKTTACVGLAARSVGSGHRVLYCSFHKRPEKYGYTEMESLKKLGIEVINFAKGHPHLDKSISADTLVIEVDEALKIIESKWNDVDVLILDEIIISVRDGYLQENTLIDFIKRKPENTELVMTGRGATDRLIEIADYVSFVKKIKHPYDKNIRSRKGIEF